MISVAAVADGTSAAGVRESQSLARLLLGETGAKRISESERADVAKHASSYFDDDVVVIHWNSAFVLDPSARLDVADVQFQREGLVITLARGRDPALPHGARPLPA